jgi:hypothetical protein
MQRAILFSRAGCSDSGDPHRLAFKECLIQAVVTFSRYNPDASRSAIEVSLLLYVLKYRSL